jgi:outer membrane receptor for ferrienterochelin and colicins
VTKSTHAHLRETTNAYTGNRTMMTQRWFRAAATILVTDLILITSAQDARAQDASGTVRLRVESQGTPLPGAEVRAGRTGALTNAAGRAVLRLPAGTHTVSVSLIGYTRGSTRVKVTAGTDTTLVIALEEEAIETEGVVVLSTRTGRRIEEEPVRVEVLAREEIEEKMLMTPGDISMMLNETSGLRVQTTSPSLGGATCASMGCAAATRRSSRTGCRFTADRAVR